MKTGLALSLLAFLLLLNVSTCNTNKPTENCVAIENTDCMCTMQYEPVCGCNKVTYSNACVAACNNITDYTPGECPDNT